jgi:flagellar basal-body rod protein FlgF
MNSGIYTGYSGLKAQSDALEILANNLANLNTTGFKEDKAFSTYINQSLEASQNPADLNTTINQVIQTRSSLNMESGSLNATSRDLDVAIAGSGFFVVETPRGIRYTRNGSLDLNAQSVLTTADGNPVLGANGRAITLGPGKIRIGEDGNVSLDGVEVDRLKVVAFDNVSTLEKEGKSLFISKNGREAEKSSDAKIKSGYLEQSNVNPISSMVRMVEIMRHFEAIQKSINLVMNDINAKAIEKLGR